MPDAQSKRELPGWLRTLLAHDVRLTKDVVEVANKMHPIQSYRHHLKTLEISCHGIPWLVIAFAGLYLSSGPALEFWVNLLIGLFLDIVVVAVIKASTRRRRPAYNVDDLFMTPPIDKFSFPSGHATRAVMLAGLFTCLYPLPYLLWLPVVVWSVCVAVSRILLGRHHLLDVLGGTIIGLLQILVLARVWRDQEQSVNFLKFFSGEDPWSSG